MARLVWYCEKCEMFWTLEPGRFHYSDWDEPCEGTVKPAALIPLESDD